MKKTFGILLMIVAMIGCTGIAMAGSYDYGDAIGYGSASNATGEWQRLGTKWGTDDGVTWSTDGGLTWGTGALTVGDTVIFRFLVTRAPYGRHAYDQLSAWVDWDGDSIFESSELLTAVKWLKGNTIWADEDYFRYVKGHPWQGSNPRGADLDEYFYATIELTEALIAGLTGDTTWLRARVNCTDVAFGSMSPYGYLYQGETEDYQLTIKRVAEPASLLLLGLGLLGLVGVGRKTKK